MSTPIALGRSPLPLPPEKKTKEKNARELAEFSTPSNRIQAIDRSKVDPETLKAAQGMEAMFLDYMMEQMRHTVPKNDMDLESPATDIYRGMMDSETAKTAARSGGIGLADQIVAYLESQRYTGSGRKAQGVPELSTGGTHASQSDKQ